MNGARKLAFLILAALAILAVVRFGPFSDNGEQKSLLDDLEAVNHVISFPPGQGGLPTLRLVLDVEGRYGPLGDKELSVYYRNDNYKERPGWKGVVLQAGTGAFISRSTVPSQDRSNELRDFPQGMLDTPANETEASAVATLSGSSVGEVHQRSSRRTPVTHRRTTFSRPW